MNKIMRIASTIVLFSLFSVITLNAQEINIQLGKIVNRETIINTVERFIEYQKFYILKRFNREVKIDFALDARNLMINEYERANVPAEFQDELKYPFFKEVVITDIERVTWRSYLFSVTRNYNSLFNFYNKLTDKNSSISEILIVDKDVEASFAFWDCNTIPQPPPPKCPKDCVQRAYQRLVEYYSLKY